MARRNTVFCHPSLWHAVRDAIPADHPAVDSFDLGPVGRTFHATCHVDPPISAGRPLLPPGRHDHTLEERPGLRVRFRIDLPLRLHLLPRLLGRGDGLLELHRLSALLRWPALRGCAVTIVMCRLALAVYRDARVDVTPTGLILKPSPPPVKKLLKHG